MLWAWTINEIKGDSVAYFNWITVFEAPYRWASVKGGAHTCFVDTWTINESHLPHKTGLDVMQNHPLRRTLFSQYLISCAGVVYVGLYIAQAMIMYIIMFMLLGYCINSEALSPQQHQCLLCVFCILQRKVPLFWAFSAMSASTHSCHGRCRIEPKEPVPLSYTTRV